MKWISASIFSLVGGILIGVGADLGLLALEDPCGIGAAAHAIVLAVPLGNVMGIGGHRKFLLKSLTKADIPASILGFLLSALAAYAGLYAMDAFGAMPGLLIALTGASACSVLGYAVGLKIVART
jgi:hypothetical protein